MAKKEIKETGFALGKENYKLMAIGFAIIVLGFILLSGGGSDEGDPSRHRRPLRTVEEPATVEGALL